jgi:hypothetical protein
MQRTFLGAVGASLHEYRDDTGLTQEEVNYFGPRDKGPVSPGLRGMGR